MSSTGHWLTRLSDEDLLGMIPSEALDDLETPDQAASTIIAHLSRGAERRRRLTAKAGAEAEKEATLTERSWEQLKRQFYLFICTDDPAYAGLREKLSTSAAGFTVVAVGMISQAFGDRLGLLSGPLVSLVALLLYTTTRLGKGTFCAMFAGSAVN